MEQEQLLISSERSETTKAIKKAIFDFQGAGLVVTKGAENIHYKSKYADLADVMRTIQPTLTATGLLIMHFTKGDGFIETEITHVESEEFFINTYNLNAISKTPQAIGSALTYAKRYAIVAMLNITVDGDDDDGNAGSGASKEQPNQQPQPPANLNWLNPNTQDWFKWKGMIFNKKKTIEDVRKVFKINKANAELLVKKEDLKPGTAYWTMSTEYLSKENAKAANITNMFDISESDLQDLQIDATNYVATTKETTPATTNEAK